MYIFRAYYSLPELLAPDGMPVHAAYGFANTLIKMIATMRPSHFACVFDYALTSFRNDLEPGYKAGRTEAPADLEPQFALCEEAARALGLAVYKAQNFEADDVIATLCEQWVDASACAVIVTTDKDLAQLVREDGSVVLFDFARAKTLDAAAVREKFGVAPQQIADYLALVGDAVDNLPGVPGIGPKTAAFLIACFGALDDFPTETERWKATGIRGAARLATVWHTHRESALRIRELARARRDVPGLPVSPEGARFRAPGAEALRALARRLGRPGLLRRGAALGHCATSN